MANYRINDDVAPQSAKLRSVCEAIDSREDVKRFMEYHVCMEKLSKCIHALTI